MAKNSTITVKLLGDNKDLKATLSDSESQVGKWAKNIGKAVAVGLASAAVAVGAGLGASVKQAVNLGESINAVEVTFGDAAAGIKKLGEEAATAVGLSNAEFNGLAVQFSSFATTVAGEGGDVVKTMEDLTGRASDFASVMNLDVAEAAAVFQSGLAGETEPLKKFGIDLSAAAVEAFAFENGIAAVGETLTEAQKVQARYGLLMEQTAKTAGDFANTSDSLANRQRVLSATVKNLAARIGTALIPILSAVAAVIADKVVPWLEKRLPAAIAFLEDTLGGLAAFVQRHWGTVVDTLRGIVTVGVEIVQFFQTNQPALIGLLAALAVGFTAWAVSAAAAAAATLAAAAPIIAVVAAVGLLVAGLVAAYQNWDGFRAVVDATVAWLRDVAWPTIKAFADGIVSVFGAMVEFVRGHWDTIMQVVDFAVAYLTTAWETISKVVKAYIDIVRGYIKVVTSLIKGDWSEAWEGIKQILSGVWDAIKAIIEGALATVKLLLSAAWTAIGAGVTSAWRTITGFVSDGVGAIVDVITGLPSLVSGAVSGAFDSVWEAFKSVINRVIGAWNGLEFSMPSIDTHIPGVGKIGGFTVGTPNIPRLAGGGVLTSPTVALLGEYAGARTNPEIAAPRSMMEDSFRSVLNERQPAGPITLIIEGRPFQAMLAEHDQQLVGVLGQGRRG